MILTIFMLIYGLGWGLLMPLILAYLWKRGRKDPLYIQHLRERFGFYSGSLPQHPIWFHAVSLGEIRSAVPLIQLVLDRDDTVVITNFTPAGRREAERQFPHEIATGQLAVIWVPFDIAWCHRRFFRACSPRIALMLEVEIWPAMVLAARRAKLPLYLCNAQYSSRPMKRDAKGLRIRQRVIQKCAGAFVKSAIQAEQFASIGLPNISVTGELRFDQPIPQQQIDVATKVRQQIAHSDREVIAIASGVADEEDLYTDLIQRVAKQAEEDKRPTPLFIYVPRAPERFDAVEALLLASNLKTLRRSKVLGDIHAGTDHFVKTPFLDDTHVLLGDSMGEMYFYLTLADRVIVGGGFNERGAHNIIEALSLRKPVLVGPITWPIEFPFVEAKQAGVAQDVTTAAELIETLRVPSEVSQDSIIAFTSQHQGASQRTLQALDLVLANNTTK
ncbi:3-deoxy-D-manno-octulosonic acid transferase [Halocynthiibacter namhaensis]|uniref:3-deoxy-D-manno-octulosonic acid transferase n=1 Tax=Halocynthiibacter namhaensis TaxID=1290553 RepID=UPI000579647A|nr:glycosyltransferase N-terminal domain-containing protein [Halocynthiibacter namhaensis]